MYMPETGLCLAHEQTTEFNTRYSNTMQGPLLQYIIDLTQQ